MAATPPSSSSKRKRSSSSSPPLVETFSPYFNDEDADILLRSGDHRLFATKQSILAAASSVFEDLFLLPQPPRKKGNRSWKRKEGQNCPRGLPLVKMVEKGNDLELFLRWIHRETYSDLFNSLHPPPEPKDASFFDPIIPLLNLSRKFNIPSISLPLFQLLTHESCFRTPNVLALAVIHNNVPLARAAVDSIKIDIERQPISESTAGAVGLNPRTSKVVKSWRPWNVGADLREDLAALLPAGFYFRFSKVEMALGYSTSSADLQLDIDEFFESMKGGFPF